MQMITSVTTKGQVTIPQLVRQRLGIEVGDKIYFRDLMPHKKEVIIKLIPKNIIEELYGSLISRKKYADIKIVREKAGKLLAKKYGLNE